MSYDFQSPFFPRCMDMPIVSQNDVPVCILDLENSYLSVGDYISEGMPLVEDLGNNLIPCAPFTGMVDHIVYENNKKYYHLKRDPNAPSARYTPQDPMKKSIKEIVHILRTCGVEDQEREIWRLIHEKRGKVDSLIINAIEPEAFFAADTVLFQTYPKEVLLGGEYLRSILGAKELVIALPKNSTLKERLEKIIRSSNRFHIHEIDLSYPKASDPFILAQLFGLKFSEVKNFKKTLTVRPSTLLDIEEALLFHKPQITQIISVDGAFANEYGNFRVPIGTPYHYFLRPFSTLDSYVVIDGGPISGFAADQKKGITKNTKNILVFMPLQQEKMSDCISCGLCVKNCPCSLNPIKLYDMLTHQEIERAVRYRQDDCIACNACSSVCPSNIPLGQVISQKGDANG